MWTKTWLTMAIACLVSVITSECSRAAFADEPVAAEVTKTESQTAAELAKDEIAKWVFKLPKDPTRELKVVSTPILRWTNPAVGRVYGNVYVVTEAGSPQAILCPYKWFTPYKGLDMECLSLASSEIEGVREGATIWSTTKSGIDWKPVPGDLAAGKSPLERQRQMKKLAAEFTAELLDTRANGGGEEQQLRQMPQPVHRYESPSHHVIEGGMFAYVVGTDPELFLLLEVVDSGEKPHWRYGLVRMNSDRMAVKFQQDEVWRVEKMTLESMRNTREPYFCYLVPGIGR